MLAPYGSRPGGSSRIGSGPRSSVAKAGSMFEKTSSSHDGGAPSNQGSTGPPNTTASGHRANARAYAPSQSGSTRTSSSVQTM